jgi:hypothetical protein
MRYTSRQGRRRAFLATCALVSPLLFSVASPVRAQQAPGDDVVIAKVEVREARLEHTIAMLMQNSGINNIVVVNEPGKNFGMVTVQLVDQPLRKALQAIAASAGAVLEEKDGIFYLRHKTAQDTAKPDPKPTPVPVQSQPAVAVPVKAKSQYQRLILNFIQPTVFVRLLQDPDYLATFEKTNPVSATSASVNVISPGLNLLNNGSVEPSVNTIPMTPPVSGASGGAANRDGGDAGRQGGRPGGFGGGFGGGQGGGFGGGGFGAGQPPGGGGPGGAGGGFGGQQQANLRPPGILNIVASDAQNALLVEYDNPEDLARLREIIRLLDVQPQQVIVRAEFVSVNISDADAFGIDWRFQPAGNLDVNIPPESGTQPTITLAYSSGNAVANLRAAAIRNTTNIIQAPIISTINNRPASINFSTVDTILSSQNIVTGNGQIISQPVPIQLNASNGLNITPHINGDGTITLAVAPFLSTQDPRADGSFRTTFQQLQTTRIIRNGETMVLGGFITKQESRLLRKVPILSDLPIIGGLFTQRSRSVTGAEVLVFITATIIDVSGQPVNVGGTGPATPNQGNALSP